jgi:hypothetical protein
MISYRYFIRFIFSSCLLFLSHAEGISQDTLYDLYDDIYIGPYVHTGQDMIMFGFNRFDSSQSQVVSHRYDMHLKNKTIIALKASTKYFGFNYNLNSTTNEEYNVYTKYSTTGFGFGIKNIPVSLNLTNCKGGKLYEEALDPNGIPVVLMDSLLPEFKLIKFEAEATYYFNRNFKKSLMYSYLAFPRKMISSYSLKTGINTGRMTNSDSAFIPVFNYDFYEFGYHWDHAASFQHFIFQCTPGWTNFSILPYYRKNGKIRKFRIYSVLEIYAGPTLIWNKTKAINEQFSAEKTGLGFTGSAYLRLGVNLNRWLFEFRAGVTTNFLNNEHLRTIFYQVYGQFNLGYRISFKKGYGKIDDFKNKLLKADQ